MMKRLFWALRRELWESRWLYLAPLLMGATLAAGFVAYAVSQAPVLAGALDSASPRAAMIAPYDVTAGLMMIAGLLIGLIYSVDALYGDRRDRSVLLWKSLPVSDRVTVLAKLVIPTVVLPVIVWATTVAVHIVMAMTTSAVLAATGHDAMRLWPVLDLPAYAGTLIYHLLALHGLLTAPVYAWLLLVSAWATRAPLAWAILPPVAIGFLERVALGSMHFADLMLSRVGGGLGTAPSQANATLMEVMAPIPPSQFVIAPSLWGGFVVAAIFLVVTVRLRRSAQPV